jgi:integrase
VEVVRRRISMENPFSGVATAPTLDSTRRRAFTESEISAILAAARGGEWYGPSLVALYTGLRLSDIRGLTWDGNFDQDMQFLHVRPQKTARHGITVAMPIHDVLRSYFQAQKRIGPLVFPELNVARRWGKWAKSGFTKVLEKAKVPTEGATFHSWRHTFRTRLAAAGVSHDIARRLGGWTRELTAERYNHDTTELAGAISLLPAISASWQSER